MKSHNKPPSDSYELDFSCDSRLQHALLDSIRCRYFGAQDDIRECPDAAGTTDELTLSETRSGNK